MRGRTWAGGVVAGVVAAGVVGCSGGDVDEGSLPDVTTTVAEAPGPVELIGDDAFEGVDLEVRRVVPDLPAGARFAAGGGGPMELLAVGERLLTPVYVGAAHQLAVSDDLGATWDLLEIPGAGPSAGMTASPVGPSLIVKIDRPDDEREIWTTDDGVTWRGGWVGTEPPEASLGQFEGRLPDGRLAMPVLVPDGPEQLLVTGDGGTTWQQVPCPPEATRVDPDGGTSCIAPEPAGGPVLYRGAEVSVDAGRTWRWVEALGIDDDVVTRPTVEASVVGGDHRWGWIEALKPGNDRRGWLGRSSDGVTWQAVGADPCAGLGLAEAQSWWALPVPVGDGWLVTDTCESEHVARHSELYLVDQAGSGDAGGTGTGTGAGGGGGEGLTRLADVEEPGCSFGPPAVVGGAVVVPELVNAPEEGAATVSAGTPPGDRLSFLVITR